MNSLLSKSKIFFKRNGSTILTCVGSAGVVATTILAVKTTPKAIRLIDQAAMEKGEELTKLEVVKVAGPAYIPTIMTGVTTIACIFGSNVLNKRQQASLISAYALLDNSYKEYKNKVKELLGEEGHAEIRDAIAKDHYEVADLAIEPDKELFYDEFSDQYFQATLVDVLNAEYNVNRDIQTQGWATLGDFYAELGIEDYDDGGALGWSEGGNFARYWQSWLDFSHTKTVLDDGLECTIITIWGEPYMEYDNDELW